MFCFRNQTGRRRFDSFGQGGHVAQADRPVESEPSQVDENRQERSAVQVLQSKSERERQRAGLQRKRHRHYAHVQRQRSQHLVTMCAKRFDDNRSSRSERFARVDVRHRNETLLGFDQGRSGLGENVASKSVSDITM